MRLVDKFTFTHPELIALQQRLRPLKLKFDVVEVMEKGKPKKRIDSLRISEHLNLGGIECTLGKGGLHSADQPSYQVADEQWLLVECDVKSFYPTLILHHGLCPRGHPREPFLRALKRLVDKRLAAKEAGNDVLANGLKIATNSIFGKTGSPYSIWCDPTALISVTLLGQLTILTMVDLLLQVSHCVEIISLNTDSVTYRVHRQHDAAVREALDELMASHGQSLGWDSYSRIVRRDVNNYVAFGIDGRMAKAKGAYGYHRDRIKGKAVNQVAIDAMQRYFLDETAIENTVRGCSDPTKFINYRKCNRSHVIADDRGQSYGGIARWMIVSGPDGVHLDAMNRSTGERTQIVAAGARLMPELPETLPSDIDHSYYIGVAQALVDDIINPPVRSYHTIPIGELSGPQRAHFEANRDTLGADPQRCEELDLKELSASYSGVCKGNLRDSMRACLLRLWLGQEGALTQGDLLWAAHQLDAPVGYFTGSRARNLELMVEWIACDISPFAKPRNTAECAQLALAWASSNVAPCKIKRKMKHVATILGSTYLNAECLNHFATTSNEYRLACRIAAASVKHDTAPNAEFIQQVIEDVKAYVAAGLHGATKDRSARQRLQDQRNWKYFSSKGLVEDGL